MLDQLTRRWMAPLLEPLAKLALRLKLTPNFVTGCGTLVGLGCIPALALRLYPLAGGLFLLNRFLDGLDGTMARQTQPTAYGAYLDIVSDMLVYGGFVFGFALAQPENAIWAACLLFAFMGTSSSLLAYNALYPTQTSAQDNRGLDFMGGLTEGTETLLFFVSMLWWPHLFPVLAIGFSLLCHLTTVFRCIKVHRLSKPGRQA